MNFALEKSCDLQSGVSLPPVSYAEDALVRAEIRHIFRDGVCPLEIGKMIETL